MSGTFSIALTVFTTLVLRGNYCGLRCREWCFHDTWVFVVLKTMHFCCGPGLALIESEANGGKVMFQHGDDFWHYLGCAYKVDVIHVCEGLNFGTNFLQGMVGWQDRTGNGLIVSPCLTPDAEGICSASLINRWECCP